MRTSPKIVDPKNPNFLHLALSFLILRNLVSFFKKTVLAVLDRLVSPHWPYMPEKFEELHLGQASGRFKRASSSVPDDPLNYYFWYHLLEADEHGIQPCSSTTLTSKRIKCSMQNPRLVCSTLLRVGTRYNSKL